MGPQSRRTSVLIRRQSGHTHAQGTDHLGAGGGHGVSSPGEAAGGAGLGHLDLRSQPPPLRDSECVRFKSPRLACGSEREAYPPFLQQKRPPLTRPRQRAPAHLKGQRRVLGKLSGGTGTPGRTDGQTDGRRLAGSRSLPPPHHPGRSLLRSGSLRLHCNVSLCSICRELANRRRLLGDTHSFAPGPGCF